MSAPSSSSSSSSFQTRYDVFLNFRGKDTRNGFTAHLYEALCSKEIQTFMDADNILKGEEISPALVTAMDKSMFCVVVLSRNYASSPWCLDELVQILSCKNDKKQTVLPIFYGVNPSDVREQRGSFGKAFARLEKMERVQKWKQALTDVANISGWDARNRSSFYIIFFSSKVYFCFFWINIFLSLFFFFLLPLFKIIGKMFCIFF